MVVKVVVVEILKVNNEGEQGNDDLVHDKAKNKRKMERRG